MPGVTLAKTYMTHARARASARAQTHRHGAGCKGSTPPAVLCTPQWASPLRSPSLCPKVARLEQPGAWQRRARRFTSFRDLCRMQCTAPVCTCVCVEWGA